MLFLFKVLLITLKIISNLQSTRKQKTDDSLENEIINEFNLKYILMKENVLMN